jgi:hypothetical protein
MSALLLSLLLVKEGDGPSLVLKPKSERSNSSPKALSQSVVTVIMQLTLISVLLINKFRLLELEIEFTRQSLGIETRVEAALLCLL